MHVVHQRIASARKNMFGGKMLSCLGGDAVPLLPMKTLQREFVVTCLPELRFLLSLCLLKAREWQRHAVRQDSHRNVTLP